MKRYYQLPWFGQRLFEIDKEANTATLIDERTDKPVMTAQGTERKDIMKAIRVGITSYKASKKTKSVKIFDVGYFAPDNIYDDSAIPGQTTIKSKPRK